MDPQVLADIEKLTRQKAIIRQLESSDGLNLNHVMIKTGPNAGHYAGGAYGILPNSLRDLAVQSMNRNIPVDVEILIEMDKPAKQITKDLNKSRQLDDKAAEMGLRLVNLKTNGNEEMTAYAWRTGHNQSFKQVKMKFKGHPYVKAYRIEREKYLAAHPKGADRRIARDFGHTFDFFEAIPMVFSSNN